ncbi:hypothetical protein [Bacillus sp. X1(2014)]|uniref:hypothetical protein n=1 Tax=Bacillus sp. X1(2014) TaxID=1565991 RepID=UPI0011A9C081|nr:hypothetical protein [Bacillus sp. X1(2014)]
MDKKQRISWGVSFGSLALAAGLVSYFGIPNNNQIALNQGQTANNNSIQPPQQSQDGFSPQERYGHGHGFDQSTSGGSSQTDGSTNNFNNNDQSSTTTDPLYGISNQQGQFSNDGGPGMGQHGGFDTTTGGT